MRMQQLATWSGTLSIVHITHAQPNKYSIYAMALQLYAAACNTRLCMHAAKLQAFVRSVWHAPHAYTRY